VVTGLSQSASGTQGLVVVDALGPTGEYRTRTREVITDTSGVAVAELSIVPGLYATRSLAAQRKVRPLAVGHREALLAKAADIFTNSVMGGLTFDQYVDLASRVSGLPISVTGAGAGGVADAARTAFLHGARRPTRWSGLRPAPPAHSHRLRRVGASRRGVRGARVRKHPGHPRSVVAGAGIGISGGDPPLAPRAVHRAPAHLRLSRPASATRTSCICPPITRAPMRRSSARPIWPWCTAAKTSSIGTPPTLRSSPTDPAGQNPHHRRTGLARIPRRHSRFDHRHGGNGVCQRDRRAFRRRPHPAREGHRRAALDDPGVARL
jgi:hypothetical protein